MYQALFFFSSRAKEAKKHKKNAWSQVNQCCDQLTAAKTGYPLTSITWPYRGLRCRPIEVYYFFKVIRWQVTSFQMIAGSSLNWFLILNWPRKLKFSQFLQAGKTCQLLLTFLTKVTRWSCSTSKFLCSDWSKSSSETQGQIVGARESLNGRENMARRKVKNGEKVLYFFFVPYFPARLDFLLPPLPAPGSPRVGQNLIGEFMRKIYAASWN